MTITNFTFYFISFCLLQKHPSFIFIFCTVTYNKKLLYYFISLSQTPNSPIHLKRPPLYLALLPLIQVCLCHFPDSSVLPLYCYFYISFGLFLSSAASRSRPISFQQDSSFLFVLFTYFSCTSKYACVFTSAYGKSSIHLCRNRILINVVYKGTYDLTWLSMYIYPSTESIFVSTFGFADSKYLCLCLRLLALTLYSLLSCLFRYLYLYFLLCH